MQWASLPALAVEMDTPTTCVGGAGFPRLTFTHQQGKLKTCAR